METSEETPFEKTNVEYDIIWILAKCIAKIRFDQSDQLNVL